MAQRVNYSGLLIAVIGFGLTRFTVTLAIYQDPVRFYFAGVVPLALGLGLAAFGVALTVADLDPRVVQTTAVWCVIGLATMGLVAILTILGSTPGADLNIGQALSESYLSNFLIVGSIGGTLTGLYAARNRRHRENVQHQANTLVILNRLLRHEVLNAITVIRGYAMLDDREDAETVVNDHSQAIVDTIEDIKYLTNHPGPGETVRGPVTLKEALATSVETVEERQPHAAIDIADVPDHLAVEADEQLETVFVQLLENAVVHGDDPTPRVTATPTRSTVQISITDTGPGLPASQRRLLETGAIEEFDNPQTGFGLNLVRLFVDGYDGDIRTTVTDAGTTITVTLPRATPDEMTGGAPLPDFSGVRPATPHLGIAVVAALVAGGAYGLVSEALGGSVAGIGVFYGIANPVVGWLTHEFHSVVFGLMYLGFLSIAPPRLGTGFGRFLGVGLAWAVALWLGAAGVIAPVWLQLIGLTASIPNLSGTLLASHLAWGVTLAVFTYLGYRVITPRFSGV